MMIRAIIIDDELNGVRSLELLLTKFVPDVKIVATTTDAHEGIEIINNYRPELIFLDINMPGLNGFELLQRIEFRNFHLIFSTAHQEYGLRAIKQNATDYLLKPIDLEELITSVNKVKLYIKEKNEPPDIFNLLMEQAEVRNIRIPLPTKSNIDYIFPDDLLYIEANSNNSQVTLTNGNLVHVNLGLKDYETLLCKKNMHFLRIHHSFIINLRYVTRYLKEDGGYVVVQGKKTIPISKNKKEEFLKLINLSSDY
jgi:two-component system LytT family response regulator